MIVDRLSVMPETLWHRRFEIWRRASWRYAQVPFCQTFRGVATFQRPAPRLGQRQRSHLIVVLKNPVCANSATSTLCSGRKVRPRNPRSKAQGVPASMQAKTITLRWCVTLGLALPRRGKSPLSALSLRAHPAPRRLTLRWSLNQDLILHLWMSLCGALSVKFGNTDKAGQCVCSLLRMLIRVPLFAAELSLLLISRFQAILLLIP